LFDQLFAEGRVEVINQLDEDDPPHVRLLAP
jgi:hypothetical protein